MRYDAILSVKNSRTSSLETPIISNYLPEAIAGSNETRRGDMFPIPHGPVLGKLDSAS
jgi:hypothetical protein